MSTPAYLDGYPHRNDDKLFDRTVIDGWVSIELNTEVIRVPNGMVMRTRADAVDSALCFIPCDYSDFRTFIKRYRG